MLARLNAALDGRRVAAQSDARDEAELLQCVMGGDVRAFEQLYRLYHPRLTRFLLSMTRRPPLVEEVLNDTMLVVWTRPETYNGQSKLSTWIFAIAYRKALKALRNQDEPMEDAKADLRASPEVGPELQLARGELDAILLSAIGELSTDQRTVVNLSYFHDMGYREIAKVMACPVDTVKTRMFHARRHLKARLAGELADWV